jgi:NAD(P)-dependent dehydrogenase (short-subunit alcohol dehydrogenase family)
VEGNVRATILMTRCGTPVDLALALELRRRGHVVYATSLKVETVAPLQARGARVDAVDLGNWETVKALMSRLQRENAVVDLVLNHVELGHKQSPLPNDRLHQQFDIDMVAGFAILNLFGFNSGPFKRMVNLIRAPDWSSLGAASPFSGGRRLLQKLSQSQRETLAPFGVEVMAVQASGAPPMNSGDAPLFLQQLADAVLAAEAPPLAKVDGVAPFGGVLRRRPKMVG